LIISTQIEKIGESSIEDQKPLIEVVETMVPVLIVRQIDYGLIEKNE
jgi:hypothetical protein